MTRTFKGLYPQICDLENLWLAWRNARRGGKRKWPTVAGFEFDLEGNLWAGGPEGLLRMRPDGTVEELTAPAGLMELEVTSISVTPDIAVWVGTWGGGVWRFRLGRWNGWQGGQSRHWLCPPYAG